MNRKRKEKINCECLKTVSQSLLKQYLKTVFTIDVFGYDSQAYRHVQF